MGDRKEIPRGRGMDVHIISYYIFCPAKMTAMELYMNSETDRRT